MGSIYIIIFYIFPHSKCGTKKQQQPVPPTSPNYPYRYCVYTLAMPSVLNRGNLVEVSVASAIFFVGVLFLSLVANEYSELAAHSRHLVERAEERRKDCADAEHVSKAGLETVCHEAEHAIGARYAAKDLTRAVKNSFAHFVPDFISLFFVNMLENKVLQAMLIVGCFSVLVCGCCFERTVRSVFGSRTLPR